MKKINKNSHKKSIFKTLFIPLFIIMILQACIFYGAAIYGGIEETMNQNAADILAERLGNRTHELETLFNKSWTRLDYCEDELDSIYEEYREQYGEMPFTIDSSFQIEYLNRVSSLLIDTIRSNEVNGVFLILNNEQDNDSYEQNQAGEKIGICIRDLDATSSYASTDDLLVERAPSAVIDTLGCSLDSWWEAKYSFASIADGAYYYEPLNAAWENPDVDSEDLAYFQGAHYISGSDQHVISYSMPLMDKNGYPYGVLGVELTTKYVATLLPNQELDDADKSCYILALEDTATGICEPVIESGALYSRCFGSGAVISCSDTTRTGGFTVTGREGTKLYGDIESVEIYNNNNPFEAMQLTLIALVEEDSIFSYIEHIKQTLAAVSILSLLLGLVGLLVVSRLFARPITTLAEQVKSMSPHEGYQLGRLGITEIDQLVDSIENLNRDASRNIARTEFFSRMSHDMRTPMNAIISFSSPELLEEADEERKNEYLSKIHSSGVYLLGLINEVLDMTKIESNKVDLSYEILPTGQLWDTLIPIIDKLAQKKNITFHKNIRVEDAIVRVDAQHLSQIVMNLLSNAVKFTAEDGNVALDIQMTTEENNRGWLQCVITVSDDGIGMSEEFLEHMYSPFEQENDGREGTGLGLSIAKQLTEMMGGTIDCSSTQGQGTTFTLRFELQKASEYEQAEKKKQEAAQQSMEQTAVDLKGRRILVCEDHELNTQIMVKLLEREGIETVTAENGKLGVELFEASKEGSFDAVLLDIRMPVMDGLETARAIRSLGRSDAASIPIIAMTANAFAEDVKASQEAGMNAHLSKPIEPQKLYQTLREYLNGNGENKEYDKEATSIRSDKKIKS